MKLRADEHFLRPGETCFELVDDGDNLIAAIYATPKGIKIVSKYIKGTPSLTTFHGPGPGAIEINLIEAKQ